MYRLHLTTAVIITSCAYCSFTGLPTPCESVLLAYLRISAPCAQLHQLSAYVGFYALRVKFYAWNCKKPCCSESSLYRAVFVLPIPSGLVRTTFATTNLRCDKRFLTSRSIVTLNCWPVLAVLYLAVSNLEILASSPRVHPLVACLSSTGKLLVY